ncbi:MAG: energy transducer TonB [Bacteroidales bacterium]|nr:energy transducer TonB [Bacteroidales bacterium]
MEIKKSNQVSLERKKFLFLEIGVVIITAICLVAFEWSSSPAVEIENTEEPIHEYTLDHAQVAPPEKQQQMEEPVRAFEQLDFIEADKNTIVRKVIFTITDPTGDFDFPDLDDGDEPTEVVDFFKVEDQPEFDGGPYSNFSKYIAANLDYPQLAIERQISGRVYVQFTVNSKGKVVDVTVVKGIDPALDREALRIVESSPIWTPGKQRGRPVDVRFTFPIVFVLQ